MHELFIIINKGEIVANDTTETLQKNTTKQIITVEFDKQVSEKLLYTITNIEEVKLLNGNVWQLSSTSQDDVRKDIFNFAVANKLSVLTLNKEEQKMEDVFKELTKK